MTVRINGMAPKSILVVDDNPENTKLIRVLLTSVGYDVRTAKDAMTALTELETFTPDLILMDIHLPDIDGFELTRRLKSNPATSKITIIIFSASASKADEERITTTGCDGFIRKPIDTRTLAEIIAEYLRASLIE
jgi:two-component system, cell cycle response regulator DivK